MAVAVFLDKDGTLIEDLPYNADPDRIRLEKGAAEAVRAFARAGYRLIVVSNQSGVARGLFPENALGRVSRRLSEMFAELGVEMDGFYYCPHLPDAALPQYAADCDCRKPQPGLLKRAAREMGIDLHGSWMIGDILNDVEAGRKAGCRTILVDNGNETEWLVTPDRIPDFTVGDLNEAAQIVLHDWSAGRGC